MNKRKLFLAAALLAVAVVGWAAYSLNPYTAGETAGTAVSGRYEGRYLTFLESALTHPTQSDGFVNKGDIVLVGDMGIVGVALESATAATDYVAIDTEGIWNLTITNATAMSAGDEVYVDNDAATLSDSPADGLRFGYVLTAISTTGSGVVRAVKIHNDSTVLVTINSDYIQGATDSIFTFATDDNATMLGGTEFKSTGGGPGDNDYWRTRWYIQESDEYTQVEAARRDVVATDVTSTTEDTRMDWSVITAGTLGRELSLDGAALFPLGDSTLGLGKSGTGIGDTYIDGNTVTTGSIRIGASGTVVEQFGITSGTITAGATSCTLTLPWAPTQARDQIVYNLFPADARNLYAGHAADFITYEGGTTCEVRITSATFVDLHAYVYETRMW